MASKYAKEFLMPYIIIDKRTGQIEPIYKKIYGTKSGAKSGWRWALSGHLARESHKGAFDYGAYMCYQTKRTFLWYDGGIQVTQAYAEEEVAKLVAVKKEWEENHFIAELDSIVSSKTE